MKSSWTSRSAADRTPTQETVGRHERQVFTTSAAGGVSVSGLVLLWEKPPWSIHMLCLAIGAMLDKMEKPLNRHLSTAEFEKQEALFKR